MVEILDVGEPSVGPDEVIVDVVAAGICGSELHGIDRPGFRVPPLVMGHEFTGTADGRRVVVNPLLTCGACDRCDAGRTQLCRHRKLLGVHRPGGFAERVAVPRSALHAIPSSMSWDAAAMVEPMANAIHAWKLVAGLPRGRVGVIGAGTIGLVCLLGAKEGGALHVSVGDLAEERLGIARRLGADRTSRALEGEFDVIFDAVGLPATRRESVARLVPGGTAVWLGLMSPEPGFDAMALVRDEHRVFGSFAYTDEEFAEAIDLVGRSDVGWTESFPLAEGKAVFDGLRNGRTDLVKALLRP